MMFSKLCLGVKWIVEKELGKPISNFRECFVYFSGSYAFSFRLVGALGCSLAMMVFALVDSCKHPSFVLIDASAGQLYFL